MIEFVKIITKMAVALEGILFVFLLGMIVILISAPDIFLKIPYYILLLVCIGSAGYFIFCLIKVLFTYLRGDENWQQF